MKDVLVLHLWITATKTVLKGELFHEKTSNRSDCWTR